jgi:aryl-alcohol dehydrogenase-like predicted oxidoreductase
LGGNFIDTSDAYSTSENVIGNWLASKPKAFRKSIIIATKFRNIIPPYGVNDTGASRKHIFDAVEASLSRLQTNYIDLYQVHAPDEATPLRETMRALNDLVRQGKVHYIGCSNFTSWQIQKANDIAEKENLEKFVTLQQQYSLLCRNVEWDTVDVCRHEGLGILPWSPLAGGWLSGKYDRSMEKPDEGSRLVVAF